MKNKIDKDLVIADLADEIIELKANAARYEFMRDMKLYEMMLYNALPVPLEDSHDWFDAQVDERIKKRYPNAVIGE